MTSHWLFLPIAIVDAMRRSQAAKDAKRLNALAATSLVAWLSLGVSGAIWRTESIHSMWRRSRARRDDRSLCDQPVPEVGYYR
jgi:hypothetical protein